MKKTKVVVIGGGIAGLSAAHELAERDFDVTVYERNRSLGGKARSVDVRGTARGSRRPLPGEHGFRFFPGWYQNLPDTMARIPYPPTGKSVKENLVTADMNLLLAEGQAPIQVVVSFPITWERIKLAFKLPVEFAELIPKDDLEFFMRKMSQFVVSCEERRRQEIEPLSWWEYMEADRRSREFQLYLVKGATQNSVAARAETASAYTIAKMVVQTFLDVVVPGGSSDRVLNAPTQEAWIDPWREYLEQQGVTFRFGWEFDDFGWTERNEVASARFCPVRDELKVADARYTTVRFLLDVEALGQDPTQLEWRQLAARAVYVNDVQLALADASLLQPLVEALQAVSEQQTPPSAQEVRRIIVLARDLRATFIRRYRNSEVALPSHVEQLRRSWDDGTLVDYAFLAALTELTAAEGFNAPLSLLDSLPANPLRNVTDVDVLMAVVRGFENQALTNEVAKADYFVLALPVEQAAYYVNRSPTLLKHDPRLGNLVRLSEHVEWMVGIQFFLESDVKITRGHVDCLDSEWALTAISHVQFWEDVDMKDRGDGTCKSILSVDISSWYTPGKLHPKPAWDCTAEQVAEEVWDQLKRALNRPGQTPILADRQLLGGRLTRDRSFYLDDSIVERYDRKKQALFEKFRRVAFDGGMLTERQFETRRAADAPEAFGPRLSVNAEPLLVNRAGALSLRPDAKTDIRNLFLAADYVATSTNLACMEGANEAARMAVNGILKLSGLKRTPCEIRRPVEPLESLRILDKKLFDIGKRLDVFTELPLDVVGTTGKMATDMAEKAWNFLKSRL